MACFAAMPYDITPGEGRDTGTDRRTGSLGISGLNHYNPTGFVFQPRPHKLIRRELGSDSRDGSLPIASLVIGGGGVLYGTTTGGGATNQGTVFSLIPPRAPGGSWTQVVLYEFMVASDGSGHSGVVIGSGGVLYGTTATGGTQNQGTVFSLSPRASRGGSCIKTVLYNFTGADDGGFPGANVTVDHSGVALRHDHLRRDFWLGHGISTDPACHAGRLLD